MILSVELLWFDALFIYEYKYPTIINIKMVPFWDF